jgi:hypothetical protein
MGTTRSVVEGEEEQAVRYRTIGERGGDELSVHLPLRDRDVAE